MRPFIEAHALCHVVRGARILDQATIGLVPGRLTIVIGPNGAGKSTLLKLLSGEIPPSSGEVFCAGERLRDTPAWRLARRRAVMAQGALLAFPFTVYDIARMGFDTMGAGLRGDEADSVVADALTRADIFHLSHRRYDSLSGGEQQRTHFARVLCQLSIGRRSESAQALLLDEPVASLDLRHQLMLMDAAREIADSGVAVLAILHDLNLAAAYADDLVVMQAGKIVAKGAPAKILAGCLVADVFGVDLRFCATPPGNAPFVLPHGHARRIAWSRPASKQPKFAQLSNAEDANRVWSRKCAILPRNESVSMSFSQSP